MVLRTTCLVAAAIVACSHAHAAEPSMTINFVGDWCYESQEDSTTSYTRPSWTEGGRCTKILSIDEYVFYGEGRTCDLVNIRVTKKVAPAGTAYTALVTAHCQPNGPVVQGTRETLEFYRYKGRLTVTKK
jgi:hypothetical protein